MNTKIILLGNIYAIAKKIYNEDETTYCQFLNKKEDGSIDILKVKMTVKADIETLQENQTVKIPVKIVSFDGKMFYTQEEAILKG